MSLIKHHIMQKAALGEIANLRRKDINKALIISATGTGKTYLGAFDVKNFKPRRFLFVVHREQILEDEFARRHRIDGLFFILIVAVDIHVFPAFPCS